MWLFVAAKYLHISVHQAQRRRSEECVYLLSCYSPSDIPVIAMQWGGQLQPHCPSVRTGLTEFVSLVQYQWRTQELFSGRGGGGLTNSGEDRGQRERGSGGGSPRVRGSTRFADE
jgi:hypothetical protein